MFSTAWWTASSSRLAKGSPINWWEQRRRGEEELLGDLQHRLDPFLDAGFAGHAVGGVEQVRYLFDVGVDEQRCSWGLPYNGDGEEEEKHSRRRAPAKTRLS
ncbi:hypothetical protein RLJV_23830 [Pseudomonas aeruginosa]|nr:hypothetical protein RLJV_23830 [Pseudomonas aeruginosa]